MDKLKYKIIKDFGKLSEHCDIFLRLVNWNGYEKYDVRHWNDNEERPLKGITVTEDELEDLLDLLQEAITYKKPKNPVYIVPCGKIKAKVLVDFGSFSYSGDMEKHVTYTDWGRGGAYDIRPWTDDFSTCGKGICLNQEECEKLVTLIENVLGKKTQFGIAFEDFVVRSNVFRCNKNHQLENIQALISVMDRYGKVTNKTVSAAYCKHCNCYFILERDYLRLRESGLPLCRQITEKVYRTDGEEIFKGNGLNPQSFLNSIGYNVNANDDLSSKQRQDILSFAVESGLYSVGGICSFLDWLIDKNSRVTNRDMSDALNKWKQDRDYIATYKTDSRPLIGVRSLKGRSVR